MSLACGIDFGTSNSTLGRIGADGQPNLLALEGDNQTMPSVLFFGFEDNRIHFGRAAVAEYVTGAEGRLMRSLKSVLGTMLFNDTTRVKGRRLGFGEIIGTYVGELKRRAFDLLRERERLLANGGQLIACGRSQEQGRPQVGLQRSDPSPYGRLVDPQHARGPAQCLFAAQGQQDPCVIPIHRWSFLTALVQQGAAKSPRARGRRD